LNFYGGIHDRKSVSPIKSIDNDRTASEENMFLENIRKVYASHTYHQIGSMNIYRLSLTILLTISPELEYYQLVGTDFLFQYTHF
jgi:hypothetical protein